MWKTPLIRKHSQAPQNKNDRFITKSTCYHAALMATEIEAKAICTLTNSGYTAYQISAWRPDSSILVFTSNRRILTQLNLLWGVKCHYYDRFVSTDETVVDVNLIAKEKGYVKTGDSTCEPVGNACSDKGDGQHFARFSD